MLGVAVGKLRGTGGSCRYRIDGDDKLRAMGVLYGKMGNGAWRNIRYGV